MATRDQVLQEFLDAAKHAYLSRARGPKPIHSVRHIFAALEDVSPQTVEAGSRLPVCSYLDDICDPAEFADQSLRQLVEKFRALEPRLVWYLRQGGWAGASANFGDSHANAMIVGPGGLETREDVSIGVSLVGPDVLYPDHRHPPEETYLVITQGDFRQGHNEWVHVSTGETFFNPHNIVHSMRTFAHPLLVFWALREKPDRRK